MVVTVVVKTWLVVVVTVVEVVDVVVVVTARFFLFVVVLRPLPTVVVPVVLVVVDPFVAVVVAAAVVVVDVVVVVVVLVTVEVVGSHSRHLAQIAQVQSVVQGIPTTPQLLWHMSVSNRVVVVLEVVGGCELVVGSGVVVVVVVVVVGGRVMGGIVGPSLGTGVGGGCGVGTTTLVHSPQIAQSGHPHLMNQGCPLEVHKDLHSLGTPVVFDLVDVVVVVVVVVVQRPRATTRGLNIDSKSGHTEGESPAKKRPSACGHMRALRLSPLPTRCPMPGSHMPVATAASPLAQDMGAKANKRAQNIATMLLARPPCRRDKDSWN